MVEIKFTVPLPYAPTPAMAEAYPPLPEPAEVAEGVRQFYGFDGDLRDGRVNVIVVEGMPAKEIVRHAETLPADLLVMGTHGRGGFERLFLGSVTEKVLRSTRVPVLTVPPPVERAETPGRRRGEGRSHRDGRPRQWCAQSVDLRLDDAPRGSRSGVSRADPAWLIGT